MGGLCKPDSNAIFCRRELRFPTLRCCSVGRNSDSRLIELFVVVRLWEGFSNPDSQSCKSLNPVPLIRGIEGVIPVQTIIPPPLPLLPFAILPHILRSLFPIIRIILCKFPATLFLQCPILRIIRIPFPTRRLPTFRVRRSVAYRFLSYPGSSFSMPSDALSVSPYMQGHFPAAFEYIPARMPDLSQYVSCRVSLLYVSAACGFAKTGVDTRAPFHGALDHSERHL